jgi:hypothetical protein
VAGVSQILEVVDLAEPDCPAPETMSAIVHAKLDDLSEQILALQEQQKRLEQVQCYLRSRRAELR